MIRGHCFEYDTHCNFFHRNGAEGPMEFLVRLHHQFPEFACHAFGKGKTYGGKHFL